MSPDLGSPQPLIVRVETMPPRHCVADHAHLWNQLAYTISGVLTVNIEGSCFVIPPEQAAWVPIGTRHRVGSLLGADSAAYGSTTGFAPASRRTASCSASLLRTLIIKAAKLQEEQGELCRLGGSSGRRSASSCSTLFLQRCLGFVRARSWRSAKHFTPNLPISADPKYGAHSSVYQRRRLPGGSMRKSACLSHGCA
jgi:hypothetical protein